MKWIENNPICFAVIAIVALGTVEHIVDKLCDLKKKGGE